MSRYIDPQTVTEIMARPRTATPRAMPWSMTLRAIPFGLAFAFFGLSLIAPEHETRETLREYAVIAAVVFLPFSLAHVATR